MSTDYDKAEEAKALWTRYEYTLSLSGITLDGSVKTDSGSIGVYDSNLARMIAEKKWHTEKPVVLRCVDVAAHASVVLTQVAGKNVVDADRFRKAGAITKALSRGGLIRQASRDGAPVVLVSAHGDEDPGAGGVPRSGDPTGGLC